jgi:hypothetical protein
MTFFFETALPQLHAALPPEHNLYLLMVRPARLVPTIPFVKGARTGT